MATIIELEDYRPHWLSGNFECCVCKHKWIGVCHKERQNDLECPNCGEMEGKINAKELS